MSSRPDPTPPLWRRYLRFWRPDVDADVDDELRFHLEMRARDYEGRGLLPDAAEREALTRFGDVDRVRGALRDHDRRHERHRHRSEHMRELWNDIRYAVRGLAQRPGWTAAVVATLALGVGANTAIFSVVDAALLQPLPYAQPGQLVHLWSANTTDAEARSEASYPDFLDLRERTTTLTGLAGYQRGRLTLSTGDRALVLPVSRATANFFDLLGVRPAFGRTFREGEDAVGAEPVVMLTHALWTREFGADPAVVGQPVRLDGRGYTVVGVLPASFEFAAARGAELWVPIDRAAAQREARGSHWLNTVARLREGATAGMARSELATIMADLAIRFPETNAMKTMAVVPLRDELVGSVRPLLLTLYGAVGFVLLVACGNVANLLLMRGAARQREFAVRVALGAGRGRIARQLITENTLLALLGGALGIIIAHLGVRALVSAIPAERLRSLPYLRDLGVDGGALGYALLLSLLAGLLFGLMPALRASRVPVQGMLRQGGGSGGAGQGLLRDGLVAAQLALTVVLVSGAVLFGQSLTRLLAIDTGFRTEGVLTMMVPLPGASYETVAEQRRFYQELETRVAELPGVEGAGLVSKLPLDYGNSTSYAVAGDPEPAPGAPPSASFRVASDGYFATLGIPLIRGRLPLPQEDSAAAPVVVINETMAREAFGDRDPLRHQLSLGGPPVQVVGVVADVPIGELEEPIPATMYFSVRQLMDDELRLAVRTHGDPHALVAPIRAAITALDPSVGMYEVRTMDEFLAQSASVFLRRYPTLLVGTFGAVALLLALVGMYGVMSYAVAQRLRELGIRIALGAGPHSVRWLVLGHAGRVVVFGAAIGVASAIGVSRVASNQLYGVGRTDWVVILGVAALLGAMALLAALIPARRASRADPLLALRTE